MSAVGTRSMTVVTACRSRVVDVTPAGLFSSRYVAWAAVPIGRPSTRIAALSGSTC